MIEEIKNKPTELSDEEMDNVAGGKCAVFEHNNTANCWVYLCSYKNMKADYFNGIRTATTNSCPHYKFNSARATGSQQCASCSNYNYHGIHDDFDTVKNEECKYNVDYEILVTNNYN